MTNDYENTTPEMGEHMFRNSMYGSPDPVLDYSGDNVSTNISYSVVIKREDSENVRQNTEYETINECGAIPRESIEISYTDVKVEKDDLGYSKLDQSTDQQPQQRKEKPYDIPKEGRGSQEKPYDVPRKLSSDLTPDGYSHLKHN